MNKSNYHWLSGIIWYIRFEKSDTVLRQTLISSSSRSLPTSWPWTSSDCRAAPGCPAGGRQCWRPASPRAGRQGTQTGGAGGYTRAAGGSTTLQGIRGLGQTWDMLTVAMVLLARRRDGMEGALRERWRRGRWRAGLRRVGRRVGLRRSRRPSNIAVGTEL